MSAVTATWQIPYATGTDSLCTGCTITQAMANRVDDILTSFAALESAVQVRTLARAEIHYPPAQVGASPGTIVYTTVDFDTNNIADLVQPLAPITITSADLWFMGGSTFFQMAYGSGTSRVRVDSVQGLAGLYGWTQRVPQASVGALSMIGTAGYAGSAQSIYTQDRIYATTGVASQLVFWSYVWALKLGVRS
jgi:hypothetical protein